MIDNKKKIEKKMKKKKSNTELVDDLNSQLQR